MIMLGTGNFCSAKTSAAGDLDSACAKTHGVADSHLHRAAECHTTFKLTGNVLSNELSVEIGVADLDHVKGNGNLLSALILADELLNL